MNSALHEQLRQLLTLGIVEDVVDLGHGESVHIFLKREQACPLAGCSSRTWWLVMRDDVVRCPQCDREHMDAQLPPAVRAAAERALGEMI